MRSPQPLASFLLLLLAIGGAAASDANLQVHGFASQGYLDTSGNNLYGRSTGGGTFELNEFALNATATPTERVRIGVQILAYDLGKYGNDKPQIDWAFGEYQVPTRSETYDLSLVAGRFKTGHGLYNDYRDLDMTRTPVFLPSATYSATFRDVYLAANGAQVNATVRLGDAGSCDLSAYVGTQNIDANEGAISDKFKGPRGFSSIDQINFRRADGGHLNWNTPVDGLRLKGSLLHAANIVADGTSSVFLGQLPMTIDVVNYQDFQVGTELQRGSWTFASEFSNVYYHADTEVRTPSGALTSAVYSRQIGAYVSANCQLSALPAPFDRIQVFAAGNWLHDEELRDEVAGYHRGLVAAIRYDIAEHFLVKAEFQRNRGTLLVAERDNPDGVDEYWNLFSLKTTFDF